MESVIQDLRFATRTLAKSRGFAFVAIASLALGIGANSTIFSLVRATVFPALPFADAGRLVAVSEASPDVCGGCSVGTSWATYVDWQANLRSFASIGASREEGFVISGQEEPVRLSGALVSATLFPTLGVRPAIGRGFAAEDDRAGAPRVVLLSYGVWDLQFGGDTTVVGRQVRVNGQPATVVGIMPKGFGYPEFAKLWMPIGPTVGALSRSNRSVSIVARLAPNVSLGAARAELTTVHAGIARQHPEEYRNWTATATPVLDVLRADAGPPFLILLGAAGFVLLIACANLANLMLARAARRAREVAVRLALGASRARLVRMLLAECLLVSAAGAALGLLIALWGVDAIPRLLAIEIPYWIVFVVDWRVVVFAIGLCVLTAAAFGLVPALRASRPSLVTSLKEGAQASGSAGRSRLRSVLVVAQVAAALVLLTAAGVMMKAFVRTSAVDNLGYDPRGVVTANVQLLEPRYEDPTQVSTFSTEVEGRIRGIPGVSGVAASSSDFLGTSAGGRASVTLEGSSEAVADNVSPRFSRSVGADYFRVMGIPVRRGRAFATTDNASSPGVAIVNETAARALWPDADAIGKRLKLGAPNDGRPWLTVVGVAGNTVENPMGRSRPTGIVYVPFAQLPGRPVSVAIKTLSRPMDVAAAARAEIRRVDPNAATDPLRTMEASLATWIGPVRFFARLLSAMATVAMALAALGIYGVVAYAVSQRTREIGIRMALGATTRGILRLVLGYGVRMAAVGVLIGLTGSLVVTRVLRGILFDTSATDPVVFALVSLLLGTVAIAACYVPARRATRVEPVVALRHD
jgi:putative ABC transport system permease protein